MTLKSASTNETRNVEVKVFWGPTGTGKTHRASQESGRPYWLPNPNGPNALYFDGYDGQDTIIIDDFYGWIPFHTMLRLCDKYHCTLNTKGGTTSLKHKKVIITSNLPPRDWYKNVKDDLFAAFARRITHTEEMRTVYNAPAAVNPADIVRIHANGGSVVVRNFTGDAIHRTAESLARNPRFKQPFQSPRPVGPTPTETSTEPLTPNVPPFKRTKRASASQFIDLSAQEESEGDEEELSDYDSDPFS